jgi:hypothetical protein
LTVHLWDRKLTWLAVPKVACTSVKHAFFQVENDRAFDGFVAKESTSISTVPIRPAISPICPISALRAISGLPLSGILLRGFCPAMAIG